MRAISSSVFGLRSSVATASSAGMVVQLQVVVVVVAGIALHDERAIGFGNANEVAFVAKTGVAVRAESELELVALFVAFVLGEVHEGNVRDRLVVGSSGGNTGRSDIVVAPLNARLGRIPLDA